ASSAWKSGWWRTSRRSCASAASTPAISPACRGSSRWMCGAAIFSRNSAHSPDGRAGSGRAAPEDSRRIRSSRSDGEVGGGGAGGRGLGRRRSRRRRRAGADAECGRGFLERGRVLEPPARLEQGAEDVSPRQEPVGVEVVQLVEGQGDGRPLV